MFMVGAIAFATLLALYVGWSNAKERKKYEDVPGDLHKWMLLLHVRQDVKLIAFLLAGILVMLGAIADQL